MKNTEGLSHDKENAKNGLNHFYSLHNVLKNISFNFIQPLKREKNAIHQF